MFPQGKKHGKDDHFSIFHLDKKCKEKYNNKDIYTNIVRI